MRSPSCVSTEGAMFKIGHAFVVLMTHGRPDAVSQSFAWTIVCDFPPARAATHEVRWKEKDVVREGKDKRIPRD